MFVELSRNQHFWHNRKKSTVYKNGILLSSPKTLHENISLSTLPPQKSLLQAGETSKKWFKLASALEQESTVEQHLFCRDSRASCKIHFEYC